MRIAIIDDEKAVGMQIESFVKEYCKIKDVPAEIGSLRRGGFFFGELQ